MSGVGSRVEELLGRPPQGAYRVVVTRRDGDPVVIQNDPFLADGTPMPTRFWLVGESEREAVSRLESAGGVRQAEQEVSPEALRQAHELYARQRDAAVAPDHEGPVPTGGVGGARAGVKCLHAHLAWYLAGGDDPVGRWTADRLGLDPSSYVVGREADEAAVNSSGKVAVVDCGTNSTRLLIADVRGRTLARLMRITRLGEGVNVSGRLRAEAISRTVAVLEEYARVITSYHPSKVRMIATSAARDARNRDEFFETAEAVIGVAPELLSGAAEGEYAFRGATATLDSHAGPYLVADVGGGSTELAVGLVGSRPQVVSLDIGCVRVTEGYLRHDPPRRAELGEARAEIERQLAAAERSAPRLTRTDRLVAVAGTATSLAAIDGGIDSSDRSRIHHRVLTRGSVERLGAAMAREDRGMRASRKGLEPDRAGVIVGGTLVLEAIMVHFGFTECLVSEADILDGLARDLLT